MGTCSGRHRPEQLRAKGTDLRFAAGPVTAVQEKEFNQGVVVVDAAKASSTSLDSTLQNQSALLSCHSMDGPEPADVIVTVDAAFKLGLVADGMRPPASLTKEAEAGTMRLNEPAGNSPLPADVTSRLPKGEFRGDGSHRVLRQWGFLPAVDAMRNGAAVFCCVPCLPGHKLSAVEKGIAALVLDLSVFRDEFRENDVRKLQIESRKDLSGHLFVLTKTQYLLPSWQAVHALTPELYSSVDFQNGLRPDGVKVLKNPVDRDGQPVKDTFSLKRTIAWVMSVEVQFRVSTIPDAALGGLAALSDGARVDKGLLCERTKPYRGTDATVAAKQVLLFHRTPDGGALVTHVTVSVFSSLPAVYRTALGQIVSQGAKEAGLAAHRMRALLA
eukprot:TRINITY_DN1850_c0_g2_i1.p1 TRINITY_DN1850_c0_g2~~TRINITY_DN1850_c0_g2_i1.p1  ORF type:complete len:386 (+),score=77.19 TRINITY_DN1850_c0_g2_i1:81-1238(+)